VLYIGAERGRNGQGVKGIKGRGMARGLGEKRPEVDDGLTGRSRLSVGSTCQWKRERRGEPIRIDPGMGRGLHAGLGRFRPPGSISYFYFLFFFSFSAFLFLS
jgi:hypothetical protein